MGSRWCPVGQWAVERSEAEVPAAKQVVEEINYPAQKKATQAKGRETESPKEGARAVSARITKTGTSSSGAEREILKKGKEPGITGRNRWKGRVLNPPKGIFHHVGGVLGAGYVEQRCNTGLDDVQAHSINCLSDKVHWEV